MGNEKLLAQSEAVQQINDPDVQSIIDDLIDSMRHYGGVGIAAPQIGYFLRIFVFEIGYNERYPHAEPIPLGCLINPQVDIVSQQRESDWEGCLSVPGYRGLVPRYTHIRYRGFDRNGNLIEGEAKDFYARLIQHELDHLDGVLFPMRVEDMRYFGCDDMLWERITGQSYPEHMKQKILEQWDL